MAITPIQLVQPQAMIATTKTYYTATMRTRIDKATFTNTDGASAHTVSNYLVPSGGTASSGTQISVTHSLAPGETWNCPDLVGQILEAGGTFQSTGATSITISLAGVLIS